MTKKPEVKPIPKVEEIEVPVPDGSDTAVLDAIKELTSTCAQIVESLNAMRDEYKLKTRAGIFDQKGVS